MAPCHPPLNFVANGSSGSAFPPPLDPSDVPLNTQQPTFSQVACETLVSECDQPDPISAIDELPAIADTIDALAAASDSQLAAILDELDSVVGTNDQEQAFSDFAGAQPGAEQLVGGVAGVDVPAAGQIPMVLPNGAATITFGGPPAQGGPAVAGSAQYTLHLRVLAVGAGVHQVRALELTGPNPPFVGVETGTGPLAIETGPDGKQYWTALVLINPAAGGQFTAVLYYAADVTLTGLTGTVQRTLPFEVVVTSG